MKKEDLTGIIVYLLILAGAVLFGVFVLQNHAIESGLDTVSYILYIVGAIAVGVLLNSIMFEIAHIIGAKIGRYNIVSVAILGLTWIKENDKTKVKFASYDGLTGETKIVPKPDAKKEPNPTPYLLFGALFYTIEIVTIVVLFTLFGASDIKALVNVAYFLLVVGVIGGMIFVYNILPFRLDSMTDGYRMRMCTNAANKKAFNELLRVEYAVSQGDTDVEIATFENITNFTADLNLNKVYFLLDKGEFKQAEELVDIILACQNNLSEKVYIRARAQKIFINLFSKPLEEAREYYDKEVSMPERRVLSNDLSMVSVRTYLLMSGLMDGSKSECMIAINNARKCFNSTPKQRQKSEANLFNEAIRKVMELHPTWKLNEYQIEYQEKPVKEKKK